MKRREEVSYLFLCYFCVLSPSPLLLIIVHVLARHDIYELTKKNTYLSIEDSSRLAEGICRTQNETALHFRLLDS